MKNKENTELGQFSISRSELEELMEEASKKGAKMALAELGLDDSNAVLDIRDLRELIKAFRMAKKDSFRLFVKWIVIGIITLITAGFISLIGDNIKLK